MQKYLAKLWILTELLDRNAFVSCSNINFNTDENAKGIIYGNLTYSTPSELSFEDGDL